MICKVFSFLGRGRKKQRNAGFYDLIGDLFRSDPKWVTNVSYCINYQLFAPQQFYAVNVLLTNYLQQYGKKDFQQS